MGQNQLIFRTETRVGRWAAARVENKSRVGYLLGCCEEIDVFPFLIPNFILRKAKPIDHRFLVKSAFYKSGLDSQIVKT